MGVAAYNGFDAMPVTIPDDVLIAAHMSEPELKQELALALFQRGRFTLAQASRLAEMSQLAFQALLADRQIPIHYDVEDFREDLKTLRQMDWR
jgi:predicted HTH domain antitoxin